MGQTMQMGLACNNCRVLTAEKRELALQVRTLRLEVDRAKSREARQYERANNYESALQAAEDQIRELQGQLLVSACTQSFPE